MDLCKIGCFLANCRKNKKLTQEELATILGVNNKTISRWENGKNMPDASLYKMICNILDISIEELINGEKSVKNNYEENIEKAIINTINLNEKNKKQKNKIIFILLIIIVIIIALLSASLNYYNKKHPKISIFDMNVIKSESVFNKKIVDSPNFDVIYYDIDSLQLIDKNNNYFDLKSSLKFNQIKIEDIIKYLEMQVTNNNISKVILRDGGSIIYKNNKYAAILCKTQKKFNTIYFGTNSMSDNVNICSENTIDMCYFTRTYHIISISETSDDEYFEVLLNNIKDSNPTKVTINNTNNIIAGKNYEITFGTFDFFDDNTKNIFNKSTIFKIKEANNQNDNSINEKICVNNS